MLVSNFLKEFKKVLKSKNIKIKASLIIDFNIKEILLKCRDKTNNETFITLFDAEKIRKELLKYKKPNTDIFWNLITNLTNDYYKEDLLTTKELSRKLGISYYKTKEMLKEVPFYKVGNRKYYKFMEVNLHFKTKNNSKKGIKNGKKLH